jgi:hypothetical protein
MYLVRSARFGVLLFILVNAAFFRGFSVGPVTSTYLIILWVIVGCLLVAVSILRSGSIVFVNRWFVWCVLLLWIAISFGYNLIARPYPAVTVRFIAEFVLNVLLFAVFIYLPDEQLLGRLYKTYLVVSSAAGLGLMLYPLSLGMEAVRRAGGYRFPGAVNNISAMIAVGIVIAVAGIVTANNWRESKVELLTLPTLIIGLLLSGSRAAIIGLIISLGLVVVISDLSTRRLFGVLGTVTATAVIILTSVLELSGLYRFSPEALRIGFMNRVSDYQVSIGEAGLEGMSLLFGGGMYRYTSVIGSDLRPLIDNIRYPHNYVVSLLVHVGLPVAVLFTVVVIWNVRSLLSISLVRDGDPDYVTTATFLSLVVYLMYAFTSGRLTRTFPLWALLGISEFLYASRVLGTSPKTQFCTLLRRSTPADPDWSVGTSQD